MQFDSDKNDGAVLTEERRFADDQLTAGRLVSAVDWSGVFPELVLAAYREREEAAQPDGVCAIWNLKYRNMTTPEYVFRHQAPITAALLTEFHPSLVIGGTTAGQIVLWDTR